MEGAWLLSAILLKNKNYIVVNKPAGVPSQSDLSGDEDELTIAKRELNSLGENSNLWLVHRLDRVVGGVMVFARNKETSARLSELVGGRGMEKEYLAVVEGEADGGMLIDYIYKDSAKGKAFTVSTLRRGAKEAVLEYTRIAQTKTERGILTLVRIKLHTGRFHQIRVQFASRRMPLVGDGKYGSRDSLAKMPALYATRIAFEIGKDRADVTSLPNTDIYPWSLFKERLQ